MYKKYFEPGRLMEKSCYVIILAAGAGKRMGGKIAKQFLDLEGKPVLLRTIELFRVLPVKTEILLVLSTEYKEYWKKYCLEHDLWFRHTIVSGGITRFHSVKNALAHVPEGAIVAVHDGVRPFVPGKLLEKLLAFGEGKQDNEETAGIIPVLPAVESMREIIRDCHSGRIEKTVPVDRDKYLFVQTPQVFDSGKLKKAYRQAYAPEFTDDASVVESCGYKVATCEGSRFNIKITTPEDMEMARFILTFF